MSDPLLGAAIASTANIGATTSAPIVVAFHRPSLKTVSVLMAMQSGHFVRIAGGQ